jgi:hypothetical protein
MRLKGLTDEHAERTSGECARYFGKEDQGIEWVDRGNYPPPYGI